MGYLFTFKITKSATRRFVNLPRSSKNTLLVNITVLKGSKPRLCVPAMALRTNSANQGCRFLSIWWMFVGYGQVCVSDKVVLIIGDRTRLADWRRVPWKDVRKVNNCRRKRTKYRTCLSLSSNTLKLSAFWPANFHRSGQIVAISDTKCFRLLVRRWPDMSADTLWSSKWSNQSRPSLRTRFQN